MVNLVPGGVVSACFKAGDVAGAIRKDMVIGALNAKTKRFELDLRRIEGLRHLLAAFPPQCENCFNRYHCVGECPSLCPLEINWSRYSVEQAPGFRCLAQGALTETILSQAAAESWATIRAEEQKGIHFYEGFRPIVHGTPVF